MIGIDITKISRFKNKVNKKRFIERILHPEEIKLFKHSKNQVYFLASRWAIKEAIFKSDNRFFHFDRIFLNQSNRLFEFSGYNISTSQTDDYYIAFVQKKNIQ